MILLYSIQFEDLMRTYAFPLKFINLLFIYLFYYIAFYESIPKTEKISLNFTFLHNSKHDLATNTLYVYNMAKNS